MYNMFNFFVSSNAALNLTRNKKKVTNRKPTDMLARVQRRLAKGGLNFLLAEFISGLTIRLT